MPTLNIPSSQAGERFQYLQAQLQTRWQEVERFDLMDRDILVIPSLSVDQRELLKVQAYQYYEERLLFSLIQLRNPKTRLIYVTSQPLHPNIIDYYLQLLPGIPFSHARDRLVLFSTYDLSTKPLTQKILERPRLMERIRAALQLEHAYMVCYNSTHLERELSLQLDLPLFALDPDLLYWGTKGGSRELFVEAGIPHPDGSKIVWSASDLAAVTGELWERQPELHRVVIKLNEGFSGEGNALLDLREIQAVAPGAASQTERIEAIHQQFQQLQFQSKHETWSNFSSRIPELGAIAEAFLEGDEKRSPSVQGQITPAGNVEILSTHDQIFDGPGGQIFLGCNFPADAAYRLQLQKLGLEVGEKLAKKGALERFGVDFLAVRQPASLSGWDLQAIEINLRKGGTTHPFMTLKLLTNGHYDLSSGLFYSRQGCPKYYIASDNLQKQQYQGLLPNDLMDIVANYQLHFDSSTETGTVFHLIGSLSEFGKLGLTSIGNSLDQAEEIYNRVIEVLDLETKPTTDQD